MLIEFFRADDEEHATVATARWREAIVEVTSDDDDLRAVLEHAFRATPIVTDDASFRRMGTSGDVVLPPGDLEWFRAVALQRATAESGLAARAVPGITEGGFDPAAGYRGFEDQVERLSARGAGGATPQPRGSA